MRSHSTPCGRSGDFARGATSSTATPRRWRRESASRYPEAKSVDYIGRDAIERQRDEGPGRRLLFLLLENPDAWPLGAEPILYRDEVVGQVTTAVWAHSVDRALAMGYVRGTRAQVAARIDAGGFAIEIACCRFDAGASFDPPLARRRELSHA